MSRDNLLFVLLIALIFGTSTQAYNIVRARLEATTLMLRRAEIDEQHARHHALEARLASLESRVRPHFLFNTLNSITALVEEDPEEAKRTIARLAALLRFSLDAGHASLVPLELELKITLDYLAIERTRFGDRLRFAADVPAHLLSAQVPPFALQTLIENSIKHVLAPRPDRVEIRVRVREDVDGALLLEVLDDGPGFSSDAITPGHGLDGLRARLANLYGDAAALCVERTDDDLTRVAVRIRRPRTATPTPMPEPVFLEAHTATAATPAPRFAEERS